jgi:hypothetical protein
MYWFSVRAGISFAVPAVGAEFEINHYLQESSFFNLYKYVSL